MRNKYVMILLVLVIAGIAVASCAPAPTLTPVPTAVPTKAPPPTAAPMPTAVPPTPAPTTAPTALPTKAPTTAPTAAPTTASAATTGPTKAAVAGSATLAPTKATPTLVAGIPKTADDLQVISPELLKAMIEGGADIVVVDAQPKEGYALGHIKGAVNLPWDMKLKTSGNLPYDKLIVVYCACDPNAKSSDSDSGDVGMQLVSFFEYSKVALLDGGWLRWQQLKYPAEPATK
jgi:Rhodanese-like domain